MKQFVIGGLDTPEKKSEAEAILKGLGYKSNDESREGEECIFIVVYTSGGYRYHTHSCFETPITLDELRTMKNQEK